MTNRSTNSRRGVIVGSLPAWLASLILTPPIGVETLDQDPDVTRPRPEL